MNAQPSRSVSSRRSMSVVNCLTYQMHSFGARCQHVEVRRSALGTRRAFWADCVSQHERGPQFLRAERRVVAEASTQTFAWVGDVRSTRRYRTIAGVVIARGYRTRCKGRSRALSPRRSEGSARAKSGALQRPQESLEAKSRDDDHGTRRRTRVRRTCAVDGPMDRSPLWSQLIFSMSPVVPEPGRNSGPASATRAW
jgi:hypothetical protein